MDAYSAVAPFPVMWLETIVEGSLIKVHACQIFLKNAGNAISEMLYFNFFLPRVCLASSNQTNLRKPMYRSNAVHCKYMHVTQHEHKALFSQNYVLAVARGVLDLYIYKFM